MLRYGSYFSLRSVELSCWLHSHNHTYPLKYADGRGSSYQQQVTCYDFNDVNNFWALRKPGRWVWFRAMCRVWFWGWGLHYLCGDISFDHTHIEAVNGFVLHSPGNSSIPDDDSPVRNGDLVELVHLGTSRLLNSHDVAAPLSPALQEVACYINYSAQFIPHLHWRVVSVCGVM